MEYLYQYLIFLAEAVTVVVALLVVIAGIAAFSSRRQQHHEPGHLEVKKYNDQLNYLKDTVRHAMLDHAAFKKIHKRERKTAKAEGKRESKEQVDGGHGKARLFVLDFVGDLQASHLTNLRIEVTAVLTLADAKDQILVRLESPGGAVAPYGLAASQLDRIRQQGVPLIVSVDKVAASGGYLMAAVADRVLAAPFAVVGSIGVLAQVPNFHRLLKKHDVDVDVLTAGKYKRTLTTFGENTEEGRAKFIEELEDIHSLFQEYVVERRPQLNLEKVATGEAWYGQRAMDLELIDEISTSDAYLSRACEDNDVFEVRWVEHKKPIERLMSQLETGLSRLASLANFRS